MLGAAMGKKPRLFSVPPYLLRMAFMMIGRVADYERLCASLEVDGASTRETLGWAPPLSMRDGMAASFSVSDNA